MIIVLQNEFELQLPAEYVHSVDPQVLGEKYCLAAMHRQSGFDFRRFGSTGERMVVMRGRAHPSTLGPLSGDGVRGQIAEMAKNFGIDAAQTVVAVQTDELDVRFAVREQSAQLGSFVALICTQQMAYPAQFFFDDRTDPATRVEIVTQILSSVKVYDPAEQQPAPEPVAEPESAAPDADLTGVLYPVGGEPVRLRQSLNRLREKLDEAYPDKIISRLHVDHKKLGEAVTRHYRALGYPDGNSFLRAYGYTIGVVSTGRPSVHPEKLIDELKRRYPNGSPFTSLPDLASANPDIAPRLETLRVQSQKLFDTTLSTYLHRIGMLTVKAPKPAESAPVQKKPARETEANTRARLALLTEQLRACYPPGSKLPTSIVQIQMEHPDVWHPSINLWTKIFHGETTKAYLIREGIIAEKYVITPEEKERQRALEKVQREQERQRMKAESFENLAAAVATLQERYAPGSQSGYPERYPVGSISAMGTAYIGDWDFYKVHLAAQNPDISFDDMLNWARANSIWSLGKDFFERGILKPYDRKMYELYDFMRFKGTDPDGRLESEMYGRKRIEKSEREQQKKVAAQAERAARNLAELESVEETSIDAPVYHVEEVHIEGDAAKDWRYDEDRYAKGTIRISDYLGTDRHIILPASIDGVAVSGIYYYNVFTKCTAEEIEIPGCYGSVDGEFGSWNTPLKSVTIGEGIEWIGKCFSGLSKLETVRVSRGVKEIDGSAFNGTKWLRKQKDYVIAGSVLLRYAGDGFVINVPRGVETIGSKVVPKKKNAERIKKVILPDTVARLCDDAFTGCSNIESVIHTDSLREIGTKAWGSNPWSKKMKAGPVISGDCLASWFGRPKAVAVPEGITKISGSAFKGMKSLAEVTLPTSLREIGSEAFQGCKKLKRIAIPGTVEIISPFAFEECTSLAELDIGEGVTSIGERAFQQCDALTAVRLPSTIVTLGSGAFNCCEALETIDLPDGLLEMGDTAFNNCTKLRSIALPAGIDRIKERTFSLCAALRSITGLPPVIEESAFWACESLERVTFLDGMKEIPQYAFAGCLKLDNVEIPSSVKIIGEHAFRNCRSLKRIALPDGLQSLGEKAFEDCTSLAEVDGPTKIPEIGAHPFLGTPYRERLIAEDRIADAYPAIAIIPDGTMKIGDRAYYARDDIECVVMPDTVESIGKEAFTGLRQLESVKLSASLRAIDQDAFRGCFMLKMPAMPAHIERIERNAFANVKSGAVRLPKTCVHVGIGAFNGASELIIYDTIDPDTTEASEWEYNQWNGTINSQLSCALLSLSAIYAVCQGNTTWRQHHITVLSAEKDEIKFRIFCDGDDEQSDEYRALMFSAWGRCASFKFEEYDEYFRAAKSLRGKAEMALNRLCYPYHLSAKHRERYEAYIERCMYIERSARMHAELIAKTDDAGYLELLRRYSAIDAHNIEWIKEEFEKHSAAKCLEYLARRL